VTEDEARRVLLLFADARARLDEAVVTLHRADVSIADITSLSGLSRSGVAKILDRHEATTAR
jgi:hypothetical protein